MRGYGWLLACAVVVAVGCGEPPVSSIEPDGGPGGASGGSGGGLDGAGGGLDGAGGGLDGAGGGLDGAGGGLDGAGGGSDGAGGGLNGAGGGSDGAGGGSGGGLDGAGGGSSGTGGGFDGAGGGSSGTGGGSSGTGGGSSGTGGGSGGTGGGSGGAGGGSSGAGGGSSGAGGGSSGAGGGSSGAGGGTPWPGGCVSGPSGHYAARFHWEGNGSGSTAWVRYDVNNLPDASRWHAGAYRRGGVGYTPVFADVFLAEGGLDMGSTVFMDVELSLAGLSTLRHVWLAVRGRSFSTGASGSFAWMTFDGSGAAPSGFISNAAPYAWYVADATSAFQPGNASVLLRIDVGPPSNALVVNAVEVCVDGD